MDFQNYEDGTTGPSYRPGVITAIRPGILRPRRSGQLPGRGDGASLNLGAIRAPTRFDRIVARYEGNRAVRKLSCAAQYQIMAFAQLTYRESLCDIEAGACRHKRRSVTT